MLAFNSKMAINLQLQLLLNPLRIARQLDITLPANWFALFRSRHIDRAFPIGHLCAAACAEFLIGEEGSELEGEIQ